MKRSTGERTLEVMGEAKWYNDWLISWMRPELGRRVLEVGAGSGNLSGLLAREVEELVVSDVEGKYVGSLKKRWGKRVRVRRVDMEKGGRGLAAGYFDSVVCVNVLEHIKDDKRALKNMRRWLRRGGNLLLLVPAHTWLYSKFDRNLGHFRRYSEGEVEDKLGEVGFRVRIVRHLNWWGAVGWWFWFKLWGRKEMSKSPVGIFDGLGRFFLWPEKWVKLPWGLSVLAVGEKR